MTWLYFITAIHRVPPSNTPAVQLIELYGEREMHSPTDGKFYSEAIDHVPEGKRGALCELAVDKRK
jgi:hypothetical protein